MSCSSSIGEEMFTSEQQRCCSVGASCPATIMSLLFTHHHTSLVSSSLSDLCFLSPWLLPDPLLTQLALSSTPVFFLISMHAVFPFNDISAFIHLCEEGATCHNRDVEIRGQLAKIYIPSFQHLGPRDQAHIFRLGQKCLCPLSHPTSPMLCFYM